MAVCVANCLHWVGFNLVSRLTENDHRVDGIAKISTEREEEFELMLGRNSLFSLYQHENEVKDKSYSALILVDNPKLKSINASKTFNVEKEADRSACINIELPLLFGEWMPMDEKGMYTGDQYIEFCSKRFQDEAVYIDDFTNCFMQWLTITNLPEKISLTKDRNFLSEKDSLEKQMYIRENRPIDIQLSQVINHYKKIKSDERWR
ncbi:hypothetical protein VBD025_17115 [Virgibacillus flavescens]|uniref:hypothetical protein n=1 Tax=Virgibacillus flavescens TaxID=1611422 RepID=UPI003D34F7AB